MVFKTYAKLTLAIAIQQVTDFSTTERVVLEALRTIWKTLVEFDTSTFMLAWYPQIEHTVCPITRI